MSKDMGGISGSRKPSQSSVSRPVGFDPGRWQPIEIAPRDGTEILLFELTEPGPMYRVGYWDEDGEDIHSDKRMAGWSESDDGYIGCINPTHWTPLPEPPEAPNGN